MFYIYRHLMSFKTRKNISNKYHHIAGDFNLNGLDHGKIKSAKFFKFDILKCHDINYKQTYLSY